jgi:radical SAM superfamily enzyme YgiQ (UPF0313 family)
MKILLVGINAKYIHTCLSVRYLRQCCPDAVMREYTINDRPAQVTASIFEEQPDVALFSCYIWNINFVLEVADNLKKVLPECRIFFGGPEVSYDAKRVLDENPFVDGILRGEGEKTFSSLVQSQMNPHGILGMSYRKGGEIVSNPDRELICDLNTIPFPYTEEEMKPLSGKLIYYESSRGCPFQCSYCISSTIHSVRYLPLWRVKQELLFFIRHNVRIVKFVDRTFNADRKRTYELFEFLIANAGETTFHFEIAADLFNEEILSLLKTAPKGLFQFEIGVQSTNPSTIAAIDRKTSVAKIKNAVMSLLDIGTVHLHLDLIAGLPYEDLRTFRRSFDEVFSLHPHVLQLGFLKLLRGTKIRTQTDLFHYQYLSQPPYEILSNDFLSYGDVLVLKRVEDVFEQYYNSGVFSHAMEYLLKRWDSAFDLFLEVADFFKEHGYDKVAHSRKNLYALLCEFAKEKDMPDAFYDYLKYDYLMQNKGAATPEWSLAPYDKALLSFRFDFLKEEENIHRYLPEHEGQKVKDIIKQVHFERFFYDVLGGGKKEEHVILFDYFHEKAVKISSNKHDKFF